MVLKCGKNQMKIGGTKKKIEEELEGLFLPIVHKCTRTHK